MCSMKRSPATLASTPTCTGNPGTAPLRRRRPLPHDDAGDSMTQEIIIALDEGTTNAKAVAVQQDGRVLAKASRPLTIQTPQQGWVEQSGEQLLS
ncbi:MAG: FGGY family carbohydrate kinase, partial [Aeromonas sp.]